MKAQKNRIMHRLRRATAYCLYCVLLPIVFASPCLGAADMDGDGLDDA